MIPTLPTSALSHLSGQAAGAANALNNASTYLADQKLDPTQLKDLIHQQLGINSQTPLSPDVESFYTMGPEATPPQVPPVSTAPTMSLDSANLFNDLPRYLHEVGGPTDPTALLSAQVQVTQASLAWQLMGQIAAKGISGVSSLLNNQV